MLYKNVVKEQFRRGKHENITIESKYDITSDGNKHEETCIQWTYWFEIPIKSQEQYYLWVMGFKTVVTKDPTRLKHYKGHKSRRAETKILNLIIHQCSVHAGFHVLTYFMPCSQILESIQLCSIIWIVWSTLQVLHISRTDMLKNLETYLSLVRGFYQFIGCWLLKKKKKPIMTLTKKRNLSVTGACY